MSYRAKITESSQLSFPFAGTRAAPKWLRNFPYQFNVAGGFCLPVVYEELWTEKQRDAHSLHEVSYRACFKPQLPRFFIELLTQPGDVVYDPFLGRGTTVIEAALLGRQVIGNDANPLSSILCKPRLCPPTYGEIEERVKGITFSKSTIDIDLSMFYEEATLNEISSLRNYLISKPNRDHIDDWIAMVATNRLTGHSPGFFSVYTLPPNQAVSRERQIKINEKLSQAPLYKDTKAIILKKSAQLLKALTSQEKELLLEASKTAQLYSSSSYETPAISDNSVNLVVTSPPFLGVVNYVTDNWLRNWFNGIDSESVAQRITQSGSVIVWSNFIRDTLQELFRVLKSGGHVAFEVGEVKKGSLRLEDIVLPLAVEVGFSPVAVLVNSQKFTKTSNIWNVKNNDGGTNTNRIVVCRNKVHGYHSKHLRNY